MDAERVTLRQGIIAAVDEAIAGDEPGLLMGSRLLARAGTLRSLLRDGDGDAESRLALSMLHLCRYWFLPDGQGEEDLNRAIEMALPLFVAGVNAIPEQLLPFLADAVEGYAEDLLGEALDAGDPEVLADAAALWERIVTATADDDPSRARREARLAYSRVLLFQQSQDLADIRSAFRYAEHAISALDPDAPDWNAACQCFWLAASSWLRQEEAAFRHVERTLAENGGSARRRR
jgi:hypothetical protein